ncbi:alkaline D-peptidase [Penicillium alfredii]|uniref:Alkaline D-peptidase n=1 Tax=Penicillium alfredii TaxID=1506179 RepID=A0A9W9JYP4_9EURO|nr:alkaline D-peptidase [Penicillium alfredii]KAJ5086370.1 alkaline D-peptidase [Penicillium alfredii]
MRVLTLLLYTTTVLAGLQGPVYPAPRDLSSRSSLVAATWKNVTTALEQTFKGGGLGEETAVLLKHTTFSAGMFSLHDRGAQSLQYHHTAASSLNGSVGVKKVDADSIYRIASVSKLFTVYAGMIELDEKDWDRPLTDIFPPFKQFVEKAAKGFDPVHDVQWDKITVGDIAAHIGGLPRGGIPFDGDLLVQAVQSHSIPKRWGLPSLNLTKELARYPCAEYEDMEKCTALQYAQGTAANPPVYAPGTSPIYSNNGFILLGHTLSKLSGKSLDDLYHDTIFKPLGLKDTLSNAPTDPAVLKRSVVAGDPAASFAIKSGITKSSGGLFSTINDLAKVGTSILNSTLLPADKTRRWMKPVSFTSDLRYAAGRPWEIYRHVHPSGVVTDIYTKLGDSGYYTGLLALLPDFGVGFSILGASPHATRSAAVQLVADLIADTVIPALMDQAKNEALDNFAGTYAPKDKRFNTTLTLSVPTSAKSPPGLVVSQWISDGADLTALLPKGLMETSGIRLVPTIQDGAGSGQVAFRAATLNKPGPISGHLFSKLYDVEDWTSTLDMLTYGGLDLAEFVFHVDRKTGKADAVTPSAYRAKLGRRK